MTEERKAKIVEIFVSHEDEKGFGCGMEFTEVFMDMEDGHKQAILAASQALISKMLKKFMEEDDTLLHKLSIIETVSDMDIAAATEDAANFLDRCVKGCGGKM